MDANTADQQANKTKQSKREPKDNAGNNSKQTKHANSTCSSVKQAEPHQSTANKMSNKSTAKKNNRNQRSESSHDAVNNQQLPEELNVASKDAGNDIDQGNSKKEDSVDSESPISQKAGNTGSLLSGIGGDNENINNDDTPEVNLSMEANKSSQSIEQQQQQSITHDTHKVDVDDDSEPIPSGTGMVSRDCSASDLDGWSDILTRWHGKLSQRPKGLERLVRCGIPEPLRGEVWQLLSGAHELTSLMEQYRILVSQTAPSEQIILRDVHRTYPAHESFRPESSGSSCLLDSLFKVCKAYAIYDAEVGYCQGLSFLVAALLLHMPEEQAFCVFVRIMHHYELRNLFRNHFEELYLKFYQLDHLLEDTMPDLQQHFARLGIEPFTYASQWFLTLFTAKFPLNAVFHIMDTFLLDGMQTIFQIALALLQSSKEDLLALDFEGVLKFFRVQMPKRYRNQENVRQLINCSLEFNLKRLGRHAKSYELMKQKERLMESPLIRLQRENAKLTENNLRLEQENDDLARDLVASKIQLRTQLDLLEDRLEALRQALASSQQQCKGYLATMSDMEDDRERLEVEVGQLKEVCRRELKRAESELSRDGSIIADYKRICSQLSGRLDAKLEQVYRFISETQCELAKSATVEQCQQQFKTNSEKLIVELKSSYSEELESPTRKRPTGDMSSTVATTCIDNTAATTSGSQPLGAFVRSSLVSSLGDGEAKLELLLRHIDQLELELASTKLALVEAECKCQQLTHDLNMGASVKTVLTGAGQASSPSSSGLATKLDQVKAAVASRAPNSAASAALAKFNNLISEKLTGQAVGQPPLSAAAAAGIVGSQTNSKQVPSNSDNVTKRTINNNTNPPTLDSNANVDSYTSQC